MKHQNIKAQKIISGLLIIIVSIWLSACGADVGGNEDRTAGTITLTSLDAGGEIIGTFNITWDNDEANRSFVDIEFSSDSGETWQALPVPEPNTDNEICVPDLQAIADALALAGEDPDAIAAVDTTVEICAPNSGFTPDFGVYVWDTNTVLDCRACRIRITATDVVGNVSTSVASAEDFIINNVPQVLGAALYFDFSNDGAGAGDTITIPFDKPVELNATVAGDAFFVPVLGDGIGVFSTMRLGASNNEIVITINDLGLGSIFHLHVAGQFDATRTSRTAPSGLDILDNIAGEIIFANDTGRTAEPVGDGIDIEPAFGAVPTQMGPVMSDSRSQAVAVADLDGDNELDIVRINTSNDDSILINNGPAAWLDDATDTSNNFAPSQPLGDNNNTSVAVADIDGANGPDIIIGNSVMNLVFLNNGSGVFTPLAQPVAFDAVTGTQTVAFADVDGSNGVDVIIGVNGANRVFFNNGSGSFSDSGNALGSSDTRAIALEDIDGDGDLDLVTGNLGAGNRVYTNNGSGIFSDSLQSLGGIADTQSIVLGDIDGDGDFDLITGNEIDTNLSRVNRVWRNDGNGNFSEDETPQTLGDSDTFSLVLVDVGRDGDLDLISGNLGQADRVWINDGTGLFSDSGQRLNTATASNDTTTSIAVGDFDGDTDPDLVAVSSGLGSFDTVWLNPSRSLSQPFFVDTKQNLGTNSTRAIAYGDVDANGQADVVTGNASSQANRVYLADAAGTLFTDSGQELGTSSTFDLKLADVDGDTDLDIITGNTGSSPNKVWINSGLNSGVFVELDQFGSSSTLSIAVGDIDGDGDLDVVAGNGSFQANRVWRNNGSGVFNDVDMTSLMDTDSTNSVVLGDVDGDGDLDLITGNTGADNRVWLNGGDASGSNTGVFTDSGQALGGAASTQALALGDIDNDGDLDMVEAVVGQPNRVWINNINNLVAERGVFSENTPAQALAATASTVSIALGDIDGDGDLDLVAGNQGANDIWFNSGLHSGVFVASGKTVDSGFSFSLLFVDADNDGDQDLFIGNDATFSGVNRLWLNDF